MKSQRQVAEMINYNLTILRISETRWTGNGQWRLATRELLLYSGHEENNALHTQGVALILKQDRGHSLDGRHVDRGFSRPPSRPRNRRSA